MERPVQISLYGKILQLMIELQFNQTQFKEIVFQHILQLQEKLKNVFLLKSLMIVYKWPGKTSKILMKAKSVQSSHFGKILQLKKELLLG